MTITTIETDGVRRPGRPRALSPVQDMAIACARRDHVPWKVLMRFYGLSRRRLWDAAVRGAVLLGG